MNVSLTLPYLINLYNEINHDAFGNRLPRVNLHIGNASRQLGCFVYPLHTTGPRINNLNRCKIRISNAYCRTHNDYRDTLAHEMIHMYLWLAEVEETHHGPTFVRMMNEINQRCGYNMSVSSHERIDPSEYNISKSYFAIVNWRDGQRTITRMASTFVFEFHRAVTRYPDFKSIEWYGTLDGWFRRYPSVRTVKFFNISPEEYDKYVTTAIPLEMTSSELRLKQ